MGEFFYSLSLLSIYFLYAFLGVALTILPIMFFLSFSWPSKWHSYLAIGLMIIGAIGGIIIAEKSRKKGELICKHRVKKSRK
jgi:hypothetical protein